MYNQYYLSNDKYNIILYERTLKVKGSNLGSEQYEIISYHTNVGSLRRKLLKIYTVDNIENLSMNTFLDELEEIEKRIKEEFKL